MQRRRQCHKTKIDKSDGLQSSGDIALLFWQYTLYWNISYPMFQSWNQNLLSLTVPSYCGAILPLFVNLSQLIIEKASRVVLLVKTHWQCQRYEKRFNPGGGNGHPPVFLSLGKIHGQTIAWRATVYRIIKELDTAWSNCWMMIEA